MGRYKERGNDFKNIKYFEKKKWFPHAGPWKTIKIIYIILFDKKINQIIYIDIKSNNLLEIIK
jgi:hypothetical protein